MAQAKRITVTLPPELAALVEEVAKDEGCSTTEFIHDAVRWKAIFAYGEMKAREAGLEGVTAEEVSEIIHARRELEAAAQDRPGQ